MLPLSFRLQDHLRSVPIASEQTSVMSALVMMQTQGCDRLIVINALGQAIGSLTLQGLLPYGLDRMGVQALPAHQVGRVGVSARGASSLESEGPTLAAVRSQLDPVELLPIDTSADQVWERLHQRPTRTWVAIDAVQQILGIIDVIQVFHRGTQPTNTGPSSPWEIGCATHWMTDPALLGEILNHLPLALMLQTSEGAMLIQNPAWQLQMRDLADPQALHQDAAALLDHPGSAIAQNCRRGSTADISICLCLLKTGHEKILQLSKIPLNPVLSSVATPTWPNPPPFTLAPLLPQSPSANLPQALSLWLILVQDITEQQHLARELTARNADLIQLNRLKDEFLACISHELRTPLTAVLGLSSLLKDQTLGSLTPRQAYYAQLIYKSGRHLMSVVNDILDLTRIETGQLELVWEPIDISTVCHRALDQAQQMRLMEAKSAPDSPEPEKMPKFSLEIEPGLQTLVADELRMRQMLMHLLANALKFTEGGQAIGLTVSRWDGWIAFTVWDTGIGIPADKQHLIFQKFQQLESPLTRRFEGTGLGLALTQRLVRLHGGDITFTSKEGKGSQFTLLLPPQPPLGQTQVTDESDSFYPSDRVSIAAEPVESSGRSSRSQFVLIVEAAPQYLEQLSDLLHSWGYRVVIARSGTEAIEKARRLQPCLIYLNPVLPMLSGWDVLTLLKSTHETRHIPVVIMGSPHDETPGYETVADGFLSLPVQPKQLRQSLLALVEPESTATIARAPVTTTTVLLLSPGADHRHSGLSLPIPIEQLHQILQTQNYRLLEAEDIEQAELLARVWKPHVVLLNGAVANWSLYFQQFSHYPDLAALPLVTVTHEMTKAANQVAGLLVFPCLAEIEAIAPENQSPLLQVIQVATSGGWQPTVLAIDATHLPDSLDEAERSPKRSSRYRAETDWLQVLMHYLQTAGLQASVGRSWQEVWQQLETHHVDVLLICWTTTTASTVTQQHLKHLAERSDLPPLVVLDRRDQPTSKRPLPATLRRMVPEILPPTLPMADLLAHIQQKLR